MQSQAQKQRDTTKKIALRYDSSPSFQDLESRLILQENGERHLTTASAVQIPKYGQIRTALPAIWRSRPVAKPV